MKYIIIAISTVFLALNLQSADISPEQRAILQALQAKNAEEALIKQQREEQRSKAEAEFAKKLQREKAEKASKIEKQRKDIEDMEAGQQNITEEKLRGLFIMIFTL